MHKPDAHDGLPPRVIRSVGVQQKGIVIHMETLYHVYEGVDEHDQDQHCLR